MFQFGGNDQTTAVQKEAVHKSVPRAFQHSRGLRAGPPPKKKAMRFGGPPKPDGLDMDMIFGKGR